VRGQGLGFLEPNREPISADEPDERCAWCADCERVRSQQCGWNDISEAFAGVTMICDLCFDAARSRNRRAGVEENDSGAQ